MDFISECVPFFLKGTAGKLFSIYYPPSGDRLPERYVLHIPAFAEEMNNSRRMVARQARELAKNGYAVLVFDLFGTGDSEGDFSEATWAIWHKDIDIACQWLIAQGALSIDLWGIRCGVLLAMDFVKNSTVKVDKLLCWQPVLNGETFAMQFLRLRAAAAMMNKNVPQEKTSNLKQQLLDGQAIEVAGYILNPDLIKPLMTLPANNIDLDNAEEIIFFELVNSHEKNISPVNIKFVEQLQNKGKAVSIKTVVGSPFWLTQAIAEVPELLTETIASLA